MKKIILILFFISTLFNLSVSLNMEERKEILVNALTKEIKDSIPPPPKVKEVLRKANPKSTVLFYSFKNKDIHKLQNKFNLKHEIMNSIKIAPFLQDGGSIGFIDNEEELLLNGTLSGGFRDYQKTVGTVFKEGDNSFFTLIKVKVRLELTARTKKIEYEDCHHTFLFFKSCDTKIKFETLKYSANDIYMIKLASKYYAAEEIKFKIPKLSDKNIQAYISEGNTIYSDDKKYGLYVGEFGDCAVGPTDALPSVYEPRTNINYIYDGIITFGNYISFCPDTYRNKDCEDYYGGMDVYKLNMIFGKVKPNSSMLKHRKQMKENKKNGPYALIIYSNGMIEFRSNSNNSIFRTNIYGKGISPYSIDITENSELVISDFKGMIIYKSNPWRKLPTVEITAFEKGRRYTYVNGYASGNYYKELESLKIYIKNYEGLGIRYSFSIYFRRESK